MSGAGARVADLLVTNVGTLVSPAGIGPQRGTAFGALVVQHDVEFACIDGEIAHIGACGSWRHGAMRELDAQGHAVVPGLVDPHTHVVWAGDRLDDFEAKLRGDDYETILAPRLCRLSPAEAWVASTANAAAALRLPLAGRVESGLPSDFCILRSRDWRDLPYTLGDDVIAQVVTARETMAS